jgi:hypothetical protein
MIYFNKIIYYLLFIIYLTYKSLFGSLTSWGFGGVVW